MSSALNTSLCTERRCHLSLQLAITSTALAVVGHQASNRAVAQATLLSQPMQELLCLTLVTDGLLISQQKPVGMNGGCLTLLIGSGFESVQQSHLLAIYQWLISHQAAVKAALLVVAPDLAAYGLCLGNSHRVAPASQAVDEGITPINPHPDLQAAVVIAE